MPALPVGELTLTYHPSTHKSNGPSMSGKSHHVITLLTALHFLFISDSLDLPSFLLLKDGEARGLHVRGVGRRNSCACRVVLGISRPSKKGL